MTNPIISAFLAANARYIGEESAAAISGLPDTAWPALLEALDEINSGATDPGLDCAVAVTRETLDDFDASREKFWSEKGRREEVICAGLKAIKYERFQLRRGDSRRDQIVVDLGDMRVSLS